MKKVLITSNFNATFIESDVKIIQSFAKSKVVIGFSFKDLFRKIYYTITSDVCLIWFASIHSSILILFCKLLKRKSILIIGGVEIADLPEIEYGSLRNNWKKYFIKYSILNATKVLPVDESLKVKCEELVKSDLNNISVLPTGFDENFWKQTKKKKNVVLMVANIPDLKRFHLKGADLFVKIALKLPKIKFNLIGINKNLVNSSTKNLNFFAFTNQSELRNFYSEAKIFCQLSLSEGLPNTLCEAMLCGALPIGTKVGGIPNAIGKTGIILRNKNVDEIVNIIKINILKTHNQSSRNRVIKLFNIKNRIAKLKYFINE